MKTSVSTLLKRIHTIRHDSPWMWIATAAILWTMSLAEIAQAEPVLTFVRDTPYCYVSTTGGVTTTAFTVEFWFKASAFDSENQIFAQDNNGTGRIFLYTRNGKPYFQVSGNGITGNINLTPATWYHFACTRNSAGYGTVFINGQAVSSPTYLNMDPPPNVTVTIGLLLRVKYGFCGDISDVRIWNTARSQTDIQSLMNTRLTGSENGLIHYWPFDEGMGSTVTDKAGSAHGTITGATWSIASEVPFISQTGAWIVPPGGNWSDAANWFNGIIPNTINTMAIFTNTLPTAITITNDLTDLALNAISVHATNSITFTGNTLAMLNTSLTPRIETTNGIHTFDLPITLASLGLTAKSTISSALTFLKPIAGAGGLTINPTTTGGGTVTLAATNTYTGPTVVGCGTLVLPSLADGGQPCAAGAASANPTNLILGPGTLRYTGPAITLDRGLTMNPGNQKAALLAIDSDVTLTGPILVQSGAFIKRGTGTLTLAGTGPNMLGQMFSASINSIASYPANGDSPANGFGAFHIAEGKCILGVPGQNNRVASEVVIGGYTTSQPGQEKTAELIIADGYTRVDSYIDIGHHNGNTITAPIPLHPRLTLLGGTLSAINFIIGFGYETNQNTQPILDIYGGTFQVDNQIRFGDQRGSPTSPMHVTMNLYGGAFVHTSTSEGLQFGFRNPAANGTINLFDGLLDEYTDVRMAMYGSTSRLNLNGGVLRARNITHNSTTGISLLTFNGGVFQPRTAGYTLNGLTAVYISTNGAYIDTSRASYTIAQSLLTDPALSGAYDGGLIKLGTNTLVWTSTNSAYIGNTVVSNGTFTMLAPLPPASTLIVAPNGEALIGGSATQSFAVTSIALLNGGTLAFGLKTDGSSNDRISIASSADLATGRIALYQANTTLPFTHNGTYTLLTYAGTAPDISGLTCANAAYGKTYTFTAANNALTVTIENTTTAASLWNVNASGTWSDAGNWTVAPTEESAVRFDNIITAPVTITVAGQTAGDLYFNNTNAYTLAGSGLSLKKDATTHVESGSHAIHAPLAITGDNTVLLSPNTALQLTSISGPSSHLTIQGNGALVLTGTPDVNTLALDIPSVTFSNTITITAPVSLGRTTTLTPAINTDVTLANTLTGAAGITKSGSGLLTLTADNTYSGITTVNGGTLAIASLANGGQACAVGASSIAAANLVLAGGTLRYTGPAKTVNRGFTVNPGSQKAALLRLDSDLTTSGWINTLSGAFIKTGTGTLAVVGQSINVLGQQQASVLQAYPVYSATGDAPANGFGCFQINNGKVVLGATGQTNYFHQETMIGGYTTDQAGQETTGELEIRDGYTRCDAMLDLGYYNGDTLTAPTPLQPRITVSGGVLSAYGFIIGFGYRTNQNTRPVMDITGGTFLVDGEFRFGDQRGAIESPIHATINVYSGALIHTSTSAGMRMGGTRSTGAANATLNIFGGTVDETTTIQMGRYGSTSYVNLNGGLLKTQNLTGDTGNEYLTFNGGTLQPRAAGYTLSGLTAAYVSTNGAGIDTSLASYTIAQSLLHNPALASLVDGGLLKLGTNVLSLTSTSNTFNGPVRVLDGQLSARLGATNNLFVAATGVFNALGQRATIGDLTGEGRLTNGTIAVTGRLDAGTNNAPAGARMTVENLSLVKDMTFACDWSTNTLGQITNDFVAVTSTLAPEGAGTFDLGCTEADPITLPFSCTIMSYGSLSGHFTGWKAINTGIPVEKHVATIVTASNGVVTLEIRYGGTLFLLR